jgi:hypothetical protein
MVDPPPLEKSLDLQLISADKYLQIANILLGGGDVISRAIFRNLSYTYIFGKKNPSKTPKQTNKQTNQKKKKKKK